MTQETRGWVQRYAFERAEAQYRLCDVTGDELVLRSDVACYGCPFCRGTRYTPYPSGLSPYAMGYTYVQCHDCLVVYPWPRLTREALAAQINAPWVNRYLERALNETRYWPDYVPFPERAFRRLSGQRILDVGCGAGQFLDYLRHIGASGLGVEPNAVAVAHCRQRGLPVIQASFDEQLLDHPGLQDGVDGIVFMESICMLFDLREGLQLAHRLLRTGGALIIKIFDVESLPLRYFQGASGGGLDGLRVPVSGSARIYSRLLSQVGFKVRRVDRCHGDPLVYVGFAPEAVQGVGMHITVKLLRRVGDLALRALKQSRNFVLWAEKVS